MLWKKWFSNCRREARPSATPLPDRLGRLKIPSGTETIPRRAYEGNEKLTAVVIPGTVKSVGSRAFADCKNLRSVALGEGVETLGWQAFKQCVNLRSICLPASLQDAGGQAFAGCDFAQPVRSADGKKLFYVPPRLARGEYAVPEGTEEIGPYAFLDAESLKKALLPSGLKRIRRGAFFNSGLEEISVPAGTEVEDDAFKWLKGPVTIRWEGKTSALAQTWESLRAQGRSFLAAVRTAAPKEAYWDGAEFQALAGRCAAGETRAMEEMEDFFRLLQGEDDGFAQAAANFWRVRAYLYGSERARLELETWAEERPGARLLSPALTEKLSGASYGDALRALGFLFFEPEREYSLEGVDEQGVTEVSSYAGEEDADEDGFGGEIEYDWFYLDDCLNLPAGAEHFHAFSRRDKEANAKRFLALHDRVAELTRKEKTRE